MAEARQRVLDPGAGAKRDDSLERAAPFEHGNAHRWARYGSGCRRGRSGRTWPPSPAGGLGRRRDQVLAGDRPVELELLGDHGADPPHALGDLLLGLRREVEPHRARAAGVDEGGRARDEGDVLAQRLGEQVGGVDVVGERRPDEEAALRLRPGGLRWEEPRQRLEHRVAPRAVDRADVIDVLSPAALGEELADEVLAQRRCAEVGGLLAEHGLLHDRRRRAEPAQPDPGGEDLREGAGVEHVVAAVERVQRRQRLALEAQHPVRVVLEHEQLALAGDRDELVTAPLGHRHAARVLEGRHRIDQLRPATVGGERVEGFGERVGAHAVLVDRDLDRLGLVRAEDRHGAGVGRCLGDDHVAGVDQRLRDEVEGLLAAGGDEHVLEAPAAFPRRPSPPR